MNYNLGTEWSKKIELCNNTFRITNSNIFNPTLPKRPMSENDLSLVPKMQISARFVNNCHYSMKQWLTLVLKVYFWSRIYALWLFLKSNAGKNKQFLILIPRHPRRCGDVRKLEKNLFGWGLFEKTEIYPLNEAKSWILQSLRHFLNKVVNWLFQSAWKEVV